MSLLGLLNLLLTLARQLTTYMHDKQLLEAGQAQEIDAGLERTLNEVDRIRAAKSRVLHDPGSVFDDPDNRDRNGP